MAGPVTHAELDRLQQIAATTRAARDRCAVVVRELEEKLAEARAKFARAEAEHTLAEVAAAEARAPKLRAVAA